MSPRARADQARVSACRRLLLHVSSCRPRNESLAVVNGGFAGVGAASFTVRYGRGYVTYLAFDWSPTAPAETLELWTAVLSSVVVPTPRLGSLAAGMVVSTDGDLLSDTPASDLAFVAQMTGASLLLHRPAEEAVVPFESMLETVQVRAAVAAGAAVAAVIVVIVAAVAVVAAVVAAAAAVAAAYDTVRVSVFGWRLWSDTWSGPCAGAHRAAWRGKGDRVPRVAVPCHERLRAPRYVCCCGNGTSAAPSRGELRVRARAYTHADAHRARAAPWQAVG
jgi:hypothetical protein